MLIVSIFLFFVLTFLLASIVVAISWMAFLKSRAEESEAERGELGADESGSLIRTERLSTINFWDNVLARFDFMKILRKRIAQADLNWSVGRVTIAMALAGVVVFLIVFRWFGLVPALVSGCLAGFGPYAYILRLRNKRFQRFSENFPDVLDSLSRALRAGYPLSASMDMIAAETVAPVSTEMRKTAAEANLGVGWNRALENLGQRVPLLEVNLFISAVQLHSRTGGRLSEVMSGLAENMRESVALKGEVRALAAHGKLTGLILTILPIAIAAMMMYVSPGYMQVLYDHPYGKDLITAAVICLIVAHFVIRRIVDIKV